MTDAHLSNGKRCVRHLIREMLAIKHHITIYHHHHHHQQQQQQQQQSTKTTMTEKRWLQHAAKVWEAIRKSQLISEYSRLMT